MNSRFLRLAFHVVLFLFSSCVSIPTQSVVDKTKTDDSFVTVTPTPFQPLTISPPPNLLDPLISGSPVPTNYSHILTDLRTHYYFEAHLDYYAHVLTVDETIIYINHNDIILTNLVLAVESNFWRNCFLLDEITVNSKPSMYTLLGHKMDVVLIEPLAPDNSIVISLRFRLNLPTTDTSTLFGYKYNQINLVNWYPFIVPYVNGWLIHEPSGVGEHLVYDVADFDVIFSVTPSMVVAASAPLSGSSYHLENARTFVLSVSPYYQTTTALLGETIVTSYYFPENEISGEAILHESAKALIFFNNVFLEYPHPSLSIVEALFFDGMEYDGLFFLGKNFYSENDGTKLNYLIDLAVHETAHQWWFSHVGNDQALDPWLDEAFATYCEFLFYERVYPGIADTWWSFRVEKFSPFGNIDMDIYSTNDFQIYTNHVYLQGARFLQDLRTRLGDEIFFTFLKDYAERMGGRISTADDFFEILGSHTRADISDIVFDYFLEEP